MRLRSLRGPWVAICLRIALGLVAALMGWPAAMGQSASPLPSDGVSISGAVVDSAGRHIPDVFVRLERSSVPGAVETTTDASGSFEFHSLKVGDYTLIAQKSRLRSHSTSVSATSADEVKQVKLVLEDLSAPVNAMEFADAPNFTVAGVTDWTAVGGHGSDSSLRTSEALTREALTLKPEAEHHSVTPATPNSIESDQAEGRLRAELANDPRSFAANHQLGEFYFRAARYHESIPLFGAAYEINPSDHGNEYDLARALKEVGDFQRAREHIQKLLAAEEVADYHRLAGELDEKLADPLAAVHELEQAVRLDPSEDNYFAWGSELLLHRAVWQAEQVFRKGAGAYPKSARLLTALGTALFASARYDEAAARLCEASDLNPSDSEPYIFMGKIEMAAPDSLACVEQKLARFAQDQPGNSLANYFYAMAVWKRQQQSADPLALQQVETLLTKAVTIDNKCADGYLQLGILRSSQRKYEDAIGLYEKAIEANPQLAEAHYRLGVAYDRTGEKTKAKEEFVLHDEIEKRQAAAIEEQRREVKQFQVLPQGPSVPPAAR
ncbi:tetratricopeptide repeat protein [Acidicapsa acidisoli]|uniref:tetratricopeptide repeat protein n=1 Tax=Acidicapsa acidisoli TaxID=1615681 RepID=UPI0021E022A9|nr:tetratricopeptide repeat protein [Acidicapsa acidisoli]